MEKTEGVGVMKDKWVKLVETEHTLGGIRGIQLEGRVLKNGTGSVIGEDRCRTHIVSTKPTFESLRVSTHSVRNRVKT